MLSVPFVIAASDEEAAVADADAALRGAYRACLDAEAAGANVSLLLVRLNEAGVEFTGARVALASGNSSGAMNRAGLCKNLAEAVSVDAGTLRADALARAEGWWVTVVFGVVGAGVFVCVLFLGWRWFRRYYMCRFMESRPQVVS